MSQSAAFAGHGRTRVYATWALRILLAAVFFAAGAFKLAGAAPMVQIFDQIGVGQWFRIVTGLVEVVGAVGLLVPGFAGPAVLGLGIEMCCAVIAHLAVLHTNPAPAAVLLVLSAALAVLCWEQITALLAPRGGGLAASASLDTAPSGTRPEFRAPAVPTFINRQRSVPTMKLLHIDTSILGSGSVSRELTAMIAKRFTDGGNVEVTYRDLTAEDVPHLTVASLPSAHPASKMAGQLDAAAQAVRDESDRMLEEFLAADTVVIGAPMYNFTLPTQLKAWIDRIVIPGTTFRYGPNGPEGLAGGKRVIVAIARGGFYGPDTATVSAEHAESLLRTALGFMGIADPQFVLAEGLAAGEANKTKALASARDAVGQLAA